MDVWVVLIEDDDNKSVAVFDNGLSARRCIAHYDALGIKASVLKSKLNNSFISYVLRDVQPIRKG